MKFFEILSQRNLLLQYAQVLDWIFSEGKFEKTFISERTQSEVPLWDNKNKIQAFTKAVKKLERFSEDRFYYKSKCHTAFPGQGNQNKCAVSTIYMTKGSSEGRDLLRHIRNGIAHGRANIYIINNEEILELLDFNPAGEQTAYILIPLQYLIEIHRIYQEKEKNWRKAALRRFQNAA